MEMEISQTIIIQFFLLPTHMLSMLNSLKVLR